MTSIIQSNKECFVCRAKIGLNEHHVIYGRGKRQLSEKHGLKVYLCAYHHTGDKGVHFNKKLDLELKQEAEKCWINLNHKSIEQFIEVFGKNYL